MKYKGRIKGYTLVEMVVVIAIISVLATLSTSAFVVARDQSSVSDAAEVTLSAIRDAQNRAVSVDATNNAKVWSVEVVSDTFPDTGLQAGANAKNNITLRYYRKDPNLCLGRFYPILGTSVESPIILKGNPVKIKVEEISETGAVVNTPTRAFVAFATPFGETFITHAGSGYGCPTLETDMHWQESSKPTKEFEAVGGSTGSDKVISTKSDGNHKLRITFTKSGSTKVLYVNTNGDAYIE